MPTERSDRSIYLRVLAPLVLAALTVAVVSIIALHTLAGTRSYVGGESMWSKARSHTVAELRTRGWSGGNTKACAPLDEWLAVPLGDMAARIALERGDSDRDAIGAALVRGGNHPDDVGAMVDLYRNFGALPQMREPMAAWRRGDELIEELRALGTRICAAPGTASAAEAAANLQELERLEASFVNAEMRFSRSLSRSSRDVEHLLALLIGLLALLMVAGGIWYVTRSLRAQIEQRRALLEANARWELAAEAAGIGVFAMRPLDKSVELDARARAIYGLDEAVAGLLTRDEVSQLSVADERERLQDATEHAFTRPNEAMRVRYRIATPAGVIRHVEAMGMARRAPQSGVVDRLIGVIRDVTDEVAAARLQVERDAAERIARARSEFLSRLSHELRTPLNAVLGLAQILHMDTIDPLTPQQRQRVQLILDSGWHLLHLVDDVLDITRIDSGQLTLRPVPTDLHAVLRASLALVEPERERFGIHVVDECPAQTARVMADPARLQQVLVNLLSNGCKYNRAEGTLTLRYREHDDRVCLGIEDQGPGIAAEELAGLFQPFKRLDRTAQLPGTGLGLVVVKLLTEQMDGLVEVESDLGRGATFSVCLRRAA